MSQASLLSPAPCPFVFRDQDGLGESGVEPTAPLRRGFFMQA